MSLSDSGLPESLKVESRGPVALLRLSRPHKRNAVDNVTIAGIERFFADLPLAEIAAETGRPLGTVKTHLRRGLLMLRRTLIDEVGAP